MAIYRVESGQKTKHIKGVSPAIVTVFCQVGMVGAAIIFIYEPTSRGMHAILLDSSMSRFKNGLILPLFYKRVDSENLLTTSAADYNIQENFHIILYKGKCQTPFMAFLPRTYPGSLVYSTAQKASRFLTLLHKAATCVTTRFLQLKDKVYSAATLFLVAIYSAIMRFRGSDETSFESDYPDVLHCDIERV
jgi:hypothetical protein